jgi:quercetin dioxygenase-like cupin family protein
MPVSILSIDHATVLGNPGKDSAQILWPRNAPDAQITITRVTMAPGAVSERHVHRTSEQTWMVEQGSATLLLDDGKTRPIQAGDVVRTPPGVTHGVTNTGADELVYLSITTPPEDFSSFYTSTTPSAPAG